MYVRRRVCGVVFGNGGRPRAWTSFAGLQSGGGEDRGDALAVDARAARLGKAYASGPVG